MILLIDNYDSFVYNVAQYLQELTVEEVKTVRNDAITWEEITALNPSRIVLSPGPKHPKDSGICLSNKVYVKRITAENYYREIELFKQLSENVIEINSRILGCPKDENGLIDWKLVRQQLVIQHLLPKYQQ